MLAVQKLFLLGAVLYLITKLVLGFILYIITKRVEEKALVQKKHREHLLRDRRAKNLELYAKQYRKAAQKEKKPLHALA